MTIVDLLKERGCGNYLLTRGNRINGIRFYPIGGAHFQEFVIYLPEALELKIGNKGSKLLRQAAIETVILYWFANKHGILK